MRTTPKTFRSKPSSLACARRRSQLLILAVVLCVLPGNVLAQSVTTNDPPQYGPYSGVFLADGVGLRKPISNTHDSILLADSPWSLYCWIKTAEPVEGPEFVAGLGATTDESYRYLGIDAGKVTLSVGSGSLLVGAMKATVGEWHLIAATFDGHQFHLYSDGQSVATGDLVLGSVKPLLQMAPSFAVESSGKHFGGEIAAFTVVRRALSDAEIHQFHEMPPDFSLINFEEGSKPWPLQTRAQAGYRAPQDPSTLPRSRASFSRPTVKLRAPVGDSLIQTASQQWAFSDGWTLREAPKVEADGATLAKATYNGADWMRATVPGTVLTTMIDDGIYPDPDFGLNNLAIPESLNKQDYWYRNEFILPASLSDLRDHGAHHVELTFQGINYKALVWLNGTLLGSVKGAFCRGTFDVTSSDLPSSTSWYTPGAIGFGRPRRKRWNDGTRRSNLSGD
jgi:Concanavalin A-like lectin/glucanases superfamily